MSRKNQSATPAAVADGATISVTLYEHARDNRGTPATYDDWPAFGAMLRRMLANERASDKRDLIALGPYTLGAGMTRGTAGVERVTLGALDIDRDLPSINPLLDALEHEGWAALIYATPSDPTPKSRKVRLLAPLSRDLAPEECGPLRRVLAERLGVLADPKTLHPSCLFFVGRLERTPDRETWETRGEPIDVDRLLDGVELTPRHSSVQRNPAARDRELTDREREHLDRVIEIVEPHYDLGQRNALALALGGWLCSLGLPASAAEHVMSQLPSDDPHERVRDAQRAWQKENPAGWSKLQELLPPDALAELADEERLPLGRWRELAAHIRERRTKERTTRRRAAKGWVARVIAHVSGGNAP